VNWYWAGPLAIGGAGAALFAVLVAALQRESRRLQVVRVEVERARERVRGASSATGDGYKVPPGRC
jgi:hypothetical protein